MKGKQQTRTKIGVGVRDADGNTYVTVPTHLVTKALQHGKKVVKPDNIKGVTVYDARDGTTEV